MKTLIVLLLLAIACPCGANPVFLGTSGGVTAVVGDPVLAATQTAYNGQTAYGMGQSFVVTQSGGLYSLSVMTAGTVNNPTNTVTCRVSTSVDLTSGYLEELTYSNAPANTVITMNSATHPALSTSTTYYFGCQSNLSFGDFTFRIQASNVYADGTEYYFSAGQWNMTGGQETADAYFEVYVQ